MNAFPNRQQWIASLNGASTQANEAQWDALLLAYYQQFPSDPNAGALLQANPTSGVQAILFAGAVYLDGWPEGTPAPDFASWTIQQEAAAQSAAAAAAAAAQQATAYAQTIAETLQTLQSTDPTAPSPALTAGQLTALVWVANQSPSVKQALQASSS